MPLLKWKVRKVLNCHKKEKTGAVVAKHIVVRRNLQPWNRWRNLEEKCVPIAVACQTVKVMARVQDTRVRSRWKVSNLYRRYFQRENYKRYITCIIVKMARIILFLLLYYPTSLTEILNSLIICTCKGE